MIEAEEITLGAALKQHRESKVWSVRAAAKKAGIAPMYLSLLERDACGPPSDDKLQRLAEVLGEQHMETLFAKAGRVTPQVVQTILRYPTPWTEFIAAAKDLDADHLAGLKQYVVLHKGSGKTDTAKFMAKFMADLSLADEKSKRKRPAKDKAGLQRDTKERAATPKEARVSSVRRAKRVRNAPGFRLGQAGHS